MAVILTPHLQRSYPEGSLASNVLGFYTLETSEDSKTADRHEIRVGHGYYGVEEKYNELLAGTPIDVQGTSGSESGRGYTPNPSRKRPDPDH